MVKVLGRDIAPEEDTTSEPLADVPLTRSLRKKQAAANRVQQTEDSITQSSPSPQNEQEAKDFFIANNKVPEGYELVPQAPTGEEYSSFRLRKIGAPARTVNDQTEEVFDFNQTAAAKDLLYNKDKDILADEELLVEYVPEWMRDSVRVVAKGTDKYVVKPLAIGVTAAGEATADFGEVLTRAVHEGITEDSAVYKLLGVTGKEMLPFDPKTAGRKFAGDVGMMVEMAEAVPAVGSLTGIAGGTARRAAEKPLREAAEQARKEIRGRELIDSKLPDGKFNLAGAKAAEKSVSEAKRREARQVAKENTQIFEDLIKNYEEINKVEISSKGKDGKLRIDYEKARSEGKRIIDETLIGKSQFDELGGPDDARLLDIVLDADKLDSVVATIAKVKEMNPDAFKGSKNVIETLFDESVKGNLIASDDLLQILEKYGLSMDDYIMMTVGSGSKYGRGLQKFRQMRDAMGGKASKKSAAQKNDEELNDAVDMLGKARKNIRRGENVIRGAMVSAFATAARNFESALIRYPMEGLTNLMETSIILAARGDLKGSIRNVTPFIRGNGYKDAFQMYAHTFGDSAKIRRTGADGAIASRELTSEKAEFVDYILGQPEYKEQWTRFYDQVNEVQKYTGRGEGGLSDAIFEPIEDFVQFLNGPNRLQEFVTRRAYFLTDLDNALKREWGVGLEESIMNGQMRNMVNDAPSIKPKDARNFHELLAEATDKALEKTYAASPSFGPFKAALGILNKIPGGTIIIPFPRFMFKSMEYVGEVTMGMPIAVTRKMFGVGNRARDAEIASRNIAGIAGLGMAYMAVRDPNSPEDYNKVRTIVSDKVVDVSAQYPLPQLMYIAKWGHKRLEGGEGAAADWFRSSGGGKEFVKLFTGTNFRDNQGLGNLLDDLADLAESESKITTEAQFGKAAGRLLGDITARILQPYSMVIDAERAMGIRETEIKDFSTDPDMTFSGSFGKAFSQPLKSRGYYNTIMDPLEKYGLVDDVKQESDVPAREYATREGPKERLNPELKLTMGLNVMEPDTEQEKFLKQMGFKEDEFDSKTGIGTLDRVVDATVNDFLPGLTDGFMRYAEKLRKQGKSENLIRKRIRVMMKEKFKKLKSKMRRVNSIAGDDPAFIRALYAARNIPVDTQKAAMLEFEILNDRMPDLNSAEDLNALVKIAKVFKR